MNKPIRRHSTMAAPLVLLFSSFAATNIQAQNEEATPSAGAPQPTRTRQIEEVMVTARRVEESLQDTPVSVAAFSSRNSGHPYLYITSDGCPRYLRYVFGRLLEI